MYSISIIILYMEKFYKDTCMENKLPVEEDQTPMSRLRDMGGRALAFAFAAATVGYAISQTYFETKVSKGQARKLKDTVMKRAAEGGLSPSEAGEQLRTIDAVTDEMPEGHDITPDGKLSGGKDQRS
jgi:hypothetical protein